MPWGLKRYQQSGQTHSITFTCYHRRALLHSPEAKRTLERALERVRRTYHLCVYGYVVMPEHIHLLLSEPERVPLADAIKSLKQGVSRRWIGPAEHFWQKRYYDHKRPPLSNLCPEAALHPSQPGQTRTVHESGRMGVEQLSALRDRSGRRRGDRVRMDGAPPQTRRRRP